MKKTISGFTIIELVIVISIIGILSTIGVVSYIGIQVNSRDSQRLSRVTMLSEYLEKYYESNGEYPECTVLQNTTEAIKMLKGIDPIAFSSPTSANNDNSIVCRDEDIANGEDSYYYDWVTPTLTGVSAWELKFKDEKNSSTKTISSRHNLINSSLAIGAPNLSVVSASNTSISLSWTPVESATLYYIDYSLDVNSVGDDVEHVDAPDTTVTIDELQAGKTYYFQIYAVVQDRISGGRSTIISAKTTEITAPTGTMTLTGTSTGINIMFNWTQPTCTASSPRYQTKLIIETSPQYDSGWTEILYTNYRSISAQYTGFNYTLYLRAQCYSDKENSSWGSALSKTVNAQPQLPPSSPILKTPNQQYNTDRRTTEVEYSWSRPICQRGTAQYSYRITHNGGYDSEWEDILTYPGDDLESATFDAGEGYTYNFNIRARCRYYTDKAQYSYGSIIDSAWSVTTQTTIVTIVNKPGDPFGDYNDIIHHFNWSNSYKTLILTARIGCLASDSDTNIHVFGMGDAFAPNGYNWPGTSVAGWYNDSHSDQWIVPNYVDLGVYSDSSLVIARTSAIASGTTWNHTHKFICKNIVTGAQSGMVRTNDTGTSFARTVYY